MAGRQSSAVEAAVRQYRRNGGRIYRIAAKHRIAASSLYRAIRQRAKK